jgi:hypothetical protein
MEPSFTVHSPYFAGIHRLTWFVLWQETIADQIEQISTEDAVDMTKGRPGRKAFSPALPPAQRYRCFASGRTTAARIDHRHRHVRHRDEISEQIITTTRVRWRNGQTS